MFSDGPASKRVNSATTFFGVIPAFSKCPSALWWYAFPSCPQKPAGWNHNLLFPLIGPVLQHKDRFYDGTGNILSVRIINTGHPDFFSN